MTKAWKIKKFAPRVTKAEFHFFFSKNGLKSARIPFKTDLLIQGKSGRWYQADGLVTPNINVEIDGETHDDFCQQLKDEERDKDLRAAGFVIFRFKNREVWKNLASCVQVVKAFYDKHGV